MLCNAAILDDATAINFAINSGVDWPTRTGDSAVEELEAFDAEIHKQFTDLTSPEEAQSILQAENEGTPEMDQGFALGGVSIATKGITTKEGEEMAKKKFHRDDKKADTNEDGVLSAREKEIADAVQKNELVEMYHGGMAEVIMGYDDVSGNPIPLGSSAENVRDDIDAKLSTDEYVIPAHVVKWHGLKQIQMMQAEAEMGLMSMQMDGLIQQVDESEAEEPEEEEIEESDEGIDVEVAAFEVDDKLDDSDEIEKILPRTSAMPIMQKKKYAFAV